MKQEQEEQKNPKTFKWYLDKILMVVTAVFLITGVIVGIISAEKDNMTMMFAGLAAVPGTSLLISLNIILLAIKDSRAWESRLFKDGRGKSFKGQIHREDTFYKIDKPSPYHSKIVSGVIREAILNYGFLLIIIAAIVIGSIISLIWEGFGYEGKAFFCIVLIVIISIPILSYNITCSICRIQTVLRHEYIVYQAVVSKVDGSDLYIAGEKGNVYKFKYCTCLGVRAKEIHNTKLILVFVPDEVFLLPYNGWL